MHLEALGHAVLSYKSSVVCDSAASSEAVRSTGGCLQSGLCLFMNSPTALDWSLMHCAQRTKMNSNVQKQMVLEDISLHHQVNHLLEGQIMELAHWNIVLNLKEEFTR